MPAHRKLTPEVANQIVAIVRKGRPKWVAADRVGVRRQTLDAWIARGEVERPENEETPEDERIYEDLAVRLRRAAARFVCEELDRLEQDGNLTRGDWNRRKWRLKQMFPREFAEAQAVELSGPGGGAIQHEHTHDVSSDDLLAALDAFARGRPTARDGRPDAGAGGGEPDPDAEGDPRA
jgi:hypothetical protein